MTLPVVTVAEGHGNPRQVITASNMMVLDIFVGTTNYTPGCLPRLHEFVSKDE